MDFIIFLVLLVMFGISCVFSTENGGALVVMIISAICICGWVSSITTPDEQYYLEAELYTSKDDSYIFVDEDGNFWEWEDDMYVYTDQHVYLLTMNRNKTDDIKDDIILTVWSSGGEEIPAVG